MIKRNKNLQKRKNQLKMKSGLAQFVKVAGGKARWTGLSVDCELSE